MKPAASVQTDKAAIAQEIGRLSECRGQKLKKSDTTPQQIRCTDASLAA